MNVLVLGGTGNIGSAIVRALVESGARVGTLCRDERRAEHAEALSSTPLVGDIRTPEAWIGKASRFEAVIHAACTFDQEMGEVDSGSLIHAGPRGPAFVGRRIRSSLAHEATHARAKDAGANPDDEAGRACSTARSAARIRTGALPRY